jgi:predicted enzyme related to lactoylglutathione lyase
MQLKSPPTQTPPHWLVYFNVHDCDKSTKLAVEHGAKVVQAPMTVKGAGRMSVLEDAEGAMFALIKYDPTT